MAAMYQKVFRMLRECSVHFRMLLMFLVMEFLIFASYIQLSSHFISIGGTNEQLWYFEVPFLLVLSLILYFPRVEGRVVRYLMPAIPILVLYLYFDVFYSFLSRSPRPSDVQNLVTIFDFSAGLSIWIVTSAVAVVLSVTFLLYRAYLVYSPGSLAVSLSGRALLAGVVAAVLFSDAFADYFMESYEYVSWSQQRSIKNNGRFASFLYYGYRERQAFLKLSRFASSTDVSVESSLYPGAVKNRSNIHLIVLESFIDPRLLDGVEFSRDPLASGLKAYLFGQENFSLVRSPAYGGGTAQAEFELLTGVKALARIDSVEFNVMGRGNASGLVNRLAGEGYRTVATIATHSGFYNSLQAYRSLGFKDIVFLGESSGFEKRGDNAPIFDGDLLNYNLQKVRRLLDESEGPVFNYVLGMYGHFPYDRNLAVRPDVIDVVHEDERVRKIANQFYYRTRVLAEYIDALLSMDPHSIIYVTSDHLPPLLGEGIGYRMDKHMNISLLIRGGMTVDPGRKSHYEIPWLIWDWLSGERRERLPGEEEMEKLYFTVLAGSL